MWVTAETKAKLLSVTISSTAPHQHNISSKIKLPSDAGFGGKGSPFWPSSKRVMSVNDVTIAAMVRHEKSVDVHFSK